MAELTSILAGAPPVSERLLDELARRAGEESLLDVAVGEVDAPFGRLAVAITERGLVRVGFDSDEVALDVANRLSPRVLRAPRRVDPVRRQLDDYLAGRRHDFDVPLDWSLARSDFQRRILTAATAIPYGEVRTYSDVARDAGNDRAVRAAGSALGANPLCVVVPCHRVVRVGGGLGGYAGGADVKAWLLELEGSAS